MNEKHAQKAAEAKTFAQTMGWPTLLGTQRQIEWAEQIRFKWCAKSVETPAKVKALTQLLPECHVQVALNLLLEQGNAAEWIRLNGEFGSLRAWIAHKLDLEPRFAFELLFREQDMKQKFSMPAVKEGKYPHEVSVKAEADPCEQELWLEQQALKGDYMVKYVQNAAFFFLSDESDAVMFKLRWGNP